MTRNRVQLATTDRVAMLLWAIDTTVRAMTPKPYPDRDVTRTVRSTRRGFVGGFRGGADQRCPVADQEPAS